ncbi:MAG: hypothetical protein K2M44_01325 [Clostridia bacterium]|nr:hypothetical protein [Clostridia bacterium]
MKAAELIAMNLDKSQIAQTDSDIYSATSYFMKNKDWYYKTELGGKATFKLTKLGMSIPEAVKSYMEYYDIPKEYLFNYAKDYSVDTESRKSITESIKKKMKSSGATDNEINEAVNELLNIDKLVSNEDKQAIDKIIANEDK